MTVKDTSPDYAFNSRIGRPNVCSDEGINRIQGKKLRTSRESPPYRIMIAPKLLTTGTLTIRKTGLSADLRECSLLW